MPAWGVIDWFGLESKPQGCVQETSLEVSCEVATIRGDTGITTQAIDKPLRTGKITLKTKGYLDLMNVQTGPQTTQIQIIRARFAETNDDFPTSEIEAVYYE